MNVCIIPARGGSKRINKKNIKNFAGKPIIKYSIDAALNSKLFDQVIVSTDNNEIAQLAEKFGAEIPFKRPDSISDDFILNKEEGIHYKKPDMENGILQALKVDGENNENKNLMNVEY